MTVSRSKLPRKPGRPTVDPLRDRRRQVLTLLEARGKGATLREAAKLAGVHVATVCRWQARNADFRRMLKNAERFAAQAKIFDQPRCRPRIRYRRDCPKCGRYVEVRSLSYGVRFWRCSGRLCGWQSWRPRYPTDCPCGGYRLFSNSRKSVVCAVCGKRARLKWN